MGKVRKQKLENIQKNFEDKTGVQLNRKKRSVFSVGKMAAMTAALVFGFSLSAFAIRDFSSLDGDEVGFWATYLGERVICVQVENNSDKVLKFQEQLKLMRWKTGEEIVGEKEEIVFDGEKVEPHSVGMLTIDLSGAYDVDVLEQPLGEGDWYYLVLTNHNFVFGQDWMCSVDFDSTESDLEITVPDNDSEAGRIVTGEEGESGQTAAETGSGAASTLMLTDAGLRYADWTWPTENTLVTAQFGLQPNGYFSEEISVKGKEGDDVFAVADGTVMETGFDSKDGNYIVLQVEKGITVKYGHLKDIKVEAGQQVKAGKKIGKLGKTGMATGPRLSFAVYVDGEAVNPLEE